MTFEIKIRKTNSDAIIPQKHSSGAAGYDIHSLHDYTVNPNESLIIETGLLLTVPTTCKAALFARSGLASKHLMFVYGEDIGPGITDEIKVVMENKGKSQFNIKKGDRIAQMVLLKVNDSELIEVAEISETERGEKGWGSTGV